MMVSPTKQQEVRAMTKFEKRVGGWAFKVGSAEFIAMRNEAGFAHRDWEVWHLDGSKVGGMVEDQLESRRECVEAVKSKSWLWRNPSDYVRYDEGSYNAYEVTINLIVNIAPSKPMSGKELRLALFENALDHIKNESPETFVDGPQFEVHFLESGDL
jgi:hypothetical protein